MLGGLDADPPPRARRPGAEYELCPSRGTRWGSRPAALSTHQHGAGPGRWAVGGTLDPAETAWERGRGSAVAASRAVVAEYAAAHLRVGADILDSVYAPVPHLGDGVHIRRNGPVLAVYGDNLMELAPVVGDELAAAAVSGETPTVARRSG